MIFGKLETAGGAIHTHNDSYVLSEITAVSTRRPYLSAGIMVGLLLTAFSAGFWDILFPAERFTCLLLAAVSAWIGMNIGQLQLVSRDLRGSALSEAIYGTYRDLNTRRREIAQAVQKALPEGAL